MNVLIGNYEFNKTLKLNLPSLHFLESFFRFLVPARTIPLLSCFLYPESVDPVSKPVDPASKPFDLLSTFSTLSGWRSRSCDRCQRAISAWSRCLRTQKNWCNLCRFRRSRNLKKNESKYPTNVLFICCKRVVLINKNYKVIPAIQKWWFNSTRSKITFTKICKIKWRDLGALNQGRRK